MRTIVVSDIFGVIYDMKLTVLALWLLNQASPDLASVVARYLLVDARPSQAPYMIPDHLARADPLVERFERCARGRLAEGFSLDAAASGLAVKRRCRLSRYAIDSAVVPQ
jgi:hypothetical protein